ncbi:MAG: hypothetical protein H7832_07940 [Magnetococcus sp. DMHC-6]
MAPALPESVSIQQLAQSSQSLRGVNTLSTASSALARGLGDMHNTTTLRNDVVDLGGPETIDTAIKQLRGQNFLPIPESVRVAIKGLVSEVLAGLPNGESLTTPS